MKTPKNKNGTSINSLALTFERDRRTIAKVCRDLKPIGKDGKFQLYDAAEVGRALERYIAEQPQYFRRGAGPLAELLDAALELPWSKLTALETLAKQVYDVLEAESNGKMLKGDAATEFVFAKACQHLQHCAQILCVYTAVMELAHRPDDMSAEAKASVRNTVDGLDIPAVMKFLGIAQ